MGPNWIGPVAPALTSAASPAAKATAQLKEKLKGKTPDELAELFYQIQRNRKVLENQLKQTRQESEDQNEQLSTTNKMLQEHIRSLESGAASAPGGGQGTAEVEALRETNVRLEAENSKLTANMDVLKARMTALMTKFKETSLALQEAKKTPTGAGARDDQVAQLDAARRQVGKGREGSRGAGCDTPKSSFGPPAPPHPLRSTSCDSL